MRDTRIVKLLVAGALVVTTTATAQAKPLQLEVGAFAGAHFFSTTNELGRRELESDANSLKNSGMLGIRLGFILHPYVMLEAELGLVPTTTREGGAQVLAIGYRLHALFHFLTGRVRPFALIGGGGFTSSSGNPALLRQDNDGELHAGLGLKVDVKRNKWGVRLDGRVQFSPSTESFYFTEDGEITLGIYGLFGGEPKEEPKPVAEAAPPPPVVVKDSDGDGIDDANDRCPDQSGPSVNQGCPDKDADNDLIVDRMDRCPNESGPEENGGCPDKDADGDKVVDRLDKCPGQPGPESNNGCPEPDSDGDGVVDRLDKCPAAKETANNYQDEDGCPDELPKAVAQFTGAIQGITFVEGKAVIAKPSFAVLDKAVAVLKEFPTVKLEISGHTDTSGNRDKNLALSKARAEAVKKYMVDKGVAADRLTAAGYGPDKPVADNKTPAGRSKNRRVEFQLKK